MQVLRPGKERGAWSKVRTLGWYTAGGVAAAGRTVSALAPELRFVIICRGQHHHRQHTQQ